MPREKTMAMVHINITADLHERMKLLAAEKDCTISALYRYAVTMLLETTGRLY